MIDGINPKALVSDFLGVASLACVHLTVQDISVKELPAPHRPPSQLPDGKMAVYVFARSGECLKVGKVGPESQPRYTSHHYNPKSSSSNLARSILKDKEGIGSPDLNEDNIGDWIKGHTDRVNFLISRKHGLPVLTLLEAFLQCRLRPRFEGFESQRR